MVYLDNAATTFVSGEVKNAINEAMEVSYGNPSSQYVIGFNSADLIAGVRKQIADSINASEDEIFFTSGGSEANSWAIKGFLPGSPHPIIMSKIEHHSLLNAASSMSWLYVSNDTNGVVNVPELEKMISDGAKLVSIMMVNNEIGTIEPIEDIGIICKRHNVPLHVDAVQAYGHISIDVQKMNISMLSASGHKINAPKGIGFLYIKKDIQNKMVPLINGGQQEFGLRGGTENVPYIAGLGEAVRIAIANSKKDGKGYVFLKSRLLAGISKIGAKVHSPANGVPYITSFSCGDISAERWLSWFAAHEVYVSSGSACNSKSNAPSHVLTAIGLSDEEANKTIRVSFGSYTTSKDIDTFIKLLKTGKEILHG